MKNIIFFITHKTLGLDHAVCTLRSISNQGLPEGIRVDKMYIYNTHEEELSNELLLSLCKEFDLYSLVSDIQIFPYDKNTGKTLGDDLRSIVQYCSSTYDKHDRILFLKSDCVLSKNYFFDILTLEKENMVYFVAPFICAKKRVSDQEILEYAVRDKVVLSDEITFFVEDSIQSNDNDFHNRKDVSVLDNSIRFFSCYVTRDFSCHFISNGILDLININSQSWGGVNFSRLFPYFVGTDNSFVVHKFHGIESENRATDREGPVSGWLNS